MPREQGPLGSRLESGPSPQAQVNGDLGADEDARQDPAEVRAAELAGRDPRGPRLGPGERHTGVEVRHLSSVP